MFGDVLQIGVYSSDRVREGAVMPKHLNFRYGQGGGLRILASLPLEPQHL